MLKFTCLDTVHPCRLLLLFLSCSSPIHPASLSSHSSSIPCHHLTSAWAPASPPLPLASQSPSTNRTKPYLKAFPVLRVTLAYGTVGPPASHYSLCTAMPHFLIILRGTMVQREEDWALSQTNLDLDSSPVTSKLCDHSRFI